ncbi:MAG: hypothetical protein AVDCRST_MAG53-1892, partial [uncultured Solirubrobacteraceae bacterium]
ARPTDLCHRRRQPGRRQGGRDAEHRGLDGRVPLIGAEPERPYERPALAKDYYLQDDDASKGAFQPAEGGECPGGADNGLTRARRRDAWRDGDLL